MAFFILLVFNKFFGIGWFFRRQLRNLVLFDTLFLHLMLVYDLKVTRRPYAAGVIPVLNARRDCGRLVFQNIWVFTNFPSRYYVVLLALHLFLFFVTFLFRRLFCNRAGVHELGQHSLLPTQHLEKLLGLQQL